MKQTSYTISAAQNKLRAIAGDHFIALPIKVKKSDVTASLDANEVLKAGTLITKDGKTIVTSAGKAIVAATKVIGELTVTSTAGGTGGNSLKVEVVQGSGASVATSAVAASSKLTITLGTDGSSVALTPKADVLAALTISGADASKFALTSTGTTTAIAVTSETSLAGGIDYAPGNTNAYGVVYEDVIFKDLVSLDGVTGNATAIVSVFVHGVLYESEVKFTADTVVNGKAAEVVALKQILLV